MSDGTPMLLDDSLTEDELAQIAEERRSAALTERIRRDLVESGWITA